MLDLARGASRQGEIIEVVLNNGWDYMQRLLSGSKIDEPELPPPAVLRNILTDLGPVYIKLGQLLSTRPDLLPPTYIVALSSLQSTVPPVSATDIEGFIRQHLPRPNQRRCLPRLTMRRSPPVPSVKPTKPRSKMAARSPSRCNAPASKGLLIKM